MACAFALLAMTITAGAQKPAVDLTTTSLEDLMNIEVTSVSKKEEKLFQSAAAIYVITQEEIRRSGLTSIPDLLRLVPGLDVAQIDGTKWAVSARGFNGRFTNKLLVLIDGRSVYTPETSGVYWEAQDVLLEHIERIEVIRGPGGTLWGANAVNGVINIITKNSRDSQGGLVTTGGGSGERGFGSARYGGKLSDNASYKVYGKYFNRRGLVDGAGNYANDGQEALRGGGRVDWDLNDRDSISLQGEMFRTNLRETATNVSPAAPFAPHTNTTGIFTGGHILGRWTRTLSKESETALQVYFDRFNRNVFDLQESISTFDVDFQHHLALGQRHDVVWGLGYRLISDGTNSKSSNPVHFNPKEKTIQLFSAFAQEEFTLIADRLRLTVGTKVEHDDYSGFELQPTARLLWTPSNNQTVWGAVSRAVRTPSRSNRGIRVNAAAFPTAGGTTAILRLQGNENTISEDLLAFELGYRVQPVSRLSLDFATFYNSYDHLQTSEPARPFFESDPQPPHLVIPLNFANLMRGETYGAEASATWNPTRSWKLNGSYSFLRMNLHRYATSNDNKAELAEGESPHHQFQLHSFIKLPRNLELDGSLYHVSGLTTGRIPAYTRLDARLGWRMQEKVELSFAVQNLLDDHHPEFTGIGVLTSQPGRAAYGKLTWRF
jgi:iron complex outermembrane receptor protein